MGLIPRWGRSPERGGNGNWPVFLPGKSHGQRSLGGYSSPWGLKESDMTKHTHIHASPWGGGVTKNWIWLSACTCAHAHTHARNSECSRICLNLGAWGRRKIRMGLWVWDHYLYSRGCPLGFDAKSPESLGRMQKVPKWSTGEPQLMQVFKGAYTLLLSKISNAKTLKTTLKASEDIRFWTRRAQVYLLWHLHNSPLWRQSLHFTFCIQGGKQTPENDSIWVIYCCVTDHPHT